MEKVACYQNLPVYEYRIQSDVLCVTVLNYGATITGIYYIEKQSKLNMVAAFEDKQDYIDQDGPYLNAIVGPVAGRIAYGNYELNGMHQLSINHGVHHLHGGNSGVSKQLFQVHQVNETTLRFTLDTSHEEDGYPSGNYHYVIEYEIYHDTLQIRYFCLPPMQSLVNMTSHLYFHLGNLHEGILLHELMIPSTKRCHIAKEGHPDIICDIPKEGPYDFQTLTNIESRLMLGDEEFTYTKYYDVPFLLDDDTIVLYNPKNKMQLTITTDQNSVVVYTSNWFDDHLVFEHGIHGRPLCCIALETQNVPNGIHIDADKYASVYDEQHPYRQTTNYQFTRK